MSPLYVLCSYTEIFILLSIGLQLHLTGARMSNVRFLRSTFSSLRRSVLLRIRLLFGSQVPASIWNYCGGFATHTLNCCSIIGIQTVWLFRQRIQYNSLSVAVFCKRTFLSQLPSLCRTHNYLCSGTENVRLGRYKM